MEFSNQHQQNRTYNNWEFNRWLAWHEELGTLLDAESEIDRRIHLANGGLAKMKHMWYYKQTSSTQLKIRIYTAYVFPLLTYNMGTWAMNKSLEKKLDVAHRNHLRKILNIHLLDKVSNSTLYLRTNTIPLSTLTRETRWRLFGHILRLPSAAPAC